jgi:glycosyltransferase involved in cell wall biosynthesis
MIKSPLRRPREMTVKLDRRDRVVVAAGTRPSSGVEGFLIPLLAVRGIAEVRAFGDIAGVPVAGIVYRTDRRTRPVVIKLVSRLWAMIRQDHRRTRFIVGIYEIPHGFLAGITGWIKRIPWILCITGNPAYRKLRHGWRERLMFALINKASAVTVTGSISKSYLGSRGFDESKIYVLPNSVDVDRFGNPNEEKAFDIINLGRLSPEKELGNLLEIVRRIVPRRPDLRVAIAGEGPEEAMLRARIDELGLGNVVSMPGFVADKHAFYRQGKIFVLTSSTEGLPRTIIESMASGVPCVVPLVGNIGDLIRDGENGFLIPRYDDIELYVDRIDKLIREDRMRDEFGAWAIRTIREEYSFAAATRTWERVWADIERRRVRVAGK